MLDIQEYVDIKDYCTFKVGGQFRYFTEINKKEDIREAYNFSQSKNVPVLALGSGSNMVFPDGVLDVLAIKMQISSFNIVSETDEFADIQIGAGEEWDSVVSRAVDLNLAGIEAMSAIPGTTGATPVQNVGAYGQEIKDTLVSVEVFNTISQTFETLSNRECKFSYRDSIFKNKEKGKYLITSITLRLSKALPKVPDYPGVKKYFEEKGITDISHISLSQIREAIIDIRSVKLPDPKKIANVGSFFKNPIVLKIFADELKLKNPTVTLFPITDTETKVPAGWLIEHAGLKGKDFGTVSVYPNNALVLVNNGHATRADITRVKDTVIKSVQDAFGITLDAEPEFV
jgi:UDP-N-acetylmuramate dehydrogenase